jgi:hypothetical protein
MPVANGSRNCTPIVPVTLNQAFLAGPVSFGDLALKHDSDGNGTFEDDAKFQFIKDITLPPGIGPFGASWLDIPPPGSCVVYNNSNTSNTPPIATAANADAGSSFTVKGPNGSVNLPANSGQSETLNAQGTFLVPGAFTVIGTGGADIGPLTATVTFPTPPTLVSPVNNATVTRSSGMTVTWTGGAGSIQLIINSPNDNTYANGSNAQCTAPASAGTFTIPPYVLLSFPAGSGGGFVLSSFAVAPVTATGLSTGFLQTKFDVAGFGYGWGSGSFTLK